MFKALLNRSGGLLLARSRPTLGLAPRCARSFTSNTTPFYVADLDAINPRTNSDLHPGWVADAINILPSATKRRMDNRIEELKQRTLAEMAVVCINDLSGPARQQGGGPPMCYGVFAEELFDNWGIGRAGVNDGVLLIMYREARRVEIRTGRGVVSTLPDSWLHSLIQDEMIPQFKRERYAEGLEHATGLLVQRLLAGQSGAGQSGAGQSGAGQGKLGAGQSGAGQSDAGQGKGLVPRGEEGGDTVAPDGFGGGGQTGGGGRRVSLYGPSDGHSGIHDPLRLTGVIGWSLLILPLMALIAYTEYEADRRRRRCRRCLAERGVESIMDRVPSDLHDMSLGYSEVRRSQRAVLPYGRWTEGPEALSACQQLERKIGSKIYTLTRCPACQAEAVLREEGRERRYECAECKCCTREDTHTTLIHPTTSTTGLRRDDTKCQFCGKRTSYHTVLAATPKSSGGGSSGGGFGGGSSSGGGGAGGSWLIEPDAKVEIAGEMSLTPPSELILRASKAARAEWERWWPRDGGSDVAG